MGLRAIRFRREGDSLVGLKVLGAGEELLLVSERGVIVRMQADAIPQQSRAATGVRLQRLDAGDRLAEVVLVPPAPEGAEEALDPGETMQPVALGDPAVPGPLAGDAGDPDDDAADDDAADG
jgi:DNA gyrase subunit A